LRYQYNLFHDKNKTADNKQLRHLADFLRNGRFLPFEKIILPFDKVLIHYTGIFTASAMTVSDQKSELKKIA